MDVIAAARELGKAIQADERFKVIIEAQNKSDADKGLQDKISAFNLRRTELNMELQKGERDSDKIKEMDTELKAMYKEIFENPNMQAFSEAKTHMEKLLSQVQMIINGASSGDDVDEIDINAEACGGECGGCSGCH